MNPEIRRMNVVLPLSQIDTRENSHCDLMDFYCWLFGQQ